MSRTTRRVAAVVAAWYGVGGSFVGLMFGTAVGSVEVFLVGAALGLCGAASAIGLWRPTRWAPKAVNGLGLTGATLPMIMVASVATDAPRTAWIAAAVAAIIFFGVCRLIARAVAQTSRPAV